MKKKDFIWIGVLGLIVFILFYNKTHEIFVAATNAHPYIMGFVKVSILATMGELLAIRIGTGDYKKPTGLIYRFIVWGILGMAFALVFPIFAGGVKAAMGSSLLPSAGGSQFVFALLTSALMNLIFGPTFMALHRITDTYIELGQGKLNSIFKVKLNSVISKIDWSYFVSFVILKTVPIFWIPAHTVTFMLPEEYRVLVAAMLSIALGIILSLAKRTPVKASKQKNLKHSV